MSERDEGSIEVEVVIGDHAPPSPVVPARIAAVVRHVLRAEGVDEAEITVSLMDDERIADLNQQYLQHEGPTDAITFTHHDADEPPMGDICIGLEQAIRQAPEFGATQAEEVLRLAVHGTLHVLGYEHPEGAERTGSEMFVRQEALLRAFLDGGS